MNENRPLNSFTNFYAWVCQREANIINDTPPPPRVVCDVTTGTFLATTCPALGSNLLLWVHRIQPCWTCKSTVHYLLYLIYLVCDVITLLFHLLSFNNIILIILIILILLIILSTFSKVRSCQFTLLLNLEDDTRGSSER